MTAAWLLPIVATVVCASSGGIVAGVLPNNQYALWTVIVSYILWGTGVPLATCVMVIYFQRLTVYHLPPREVIVSVFLPLGPLGQGGFGVMQLGKVAMEIFPLTGTLSSSTTNSGEILYVVGWLTATIMWGFGLVWLFFALATISRSRFPFNMGWWGFTFPLGVFTASTTQMGKELPSRFFNVLGTVRFLQMCSSAFVPRITEIYFVCPFKPKFLLTVLFIDIFRLCFPSLDYGLNRNHQKGLARQTTICAMLEGLGNQRETRCESI